MNENLSGRNFRISRILGPMPWKTLIDGNVFSDPTHGKNAWWHHPTDPSRGKKKQDGSVWFVWQFNYDYFLNNFCIKIYVNDFFYFLKIIFDISISK